MAMVGCRRHFVDGDTAYWLDHNNKLNGDSYPDDPVRFIKGDYCGVRCGSDTILCEACCKQEGFVW